MLEEGVSRDIGNIIKSGRVVYAGKVRDYVFVWAVRFLSHYRNELYMLFGYRLDVASGNSKIGLTLFGRFY